MASCVKYVGAVFSPSDMRLLKLAKIADARAAAFTPKPTIGAGAAAFNGAVACFFCNMLFAAIARVPIGRAEDGVFISVVLVFVAVYLYYRHLWNKFSRISAGELQALVAEESAHANGNEETKVPGAPAP